MIRVALVGAGVMAKVPTHDLPVRRQTNPSELTTDSDSSIASIIVGNRRALDHGEIQFSHDVASLLKKREAAGESPLVVAIEIISFLSRPLSHSVRLFANMLAGHITLKVFAGFVALLGTSLGAIGWIGGIVPLILTVALTALELLVAFLQAYVFAVLTCIYLNDAIHAGH